MSQLNWWKTACAVCALCAATAVALPAQTFNTLFSFDGTDGAYPTAGVIQATDGNLYGTTSGGICTPYCGTAFKITVDGVLTSLHNFCTMSGCPDGADPAGLVQAGDGNIYGITVRGGYEAQNCHPGDEGRDPGCGTVFRLTPSGVFTTLHTFCEKSEYCKDGQFPQGALIQAMDGSLYGTTAAGGRYPGCPAGCGTVFKLTLSGVLTIVHSFTGTDGDGDVPGAGLVQGSDGSLYGTTCGKLCNGAGYGTVFKLTTNGTLTTLHTFADSDGSGPEAPLVQASDGNFYGTTYAGGANPGCNYPATGCGTLFRVTPAGVFTTLYNFCSQKSCTDGEDPLGALIQATDGNLYGTTVYGGELGGGAIFKVTPPAGSLTVVYSFGFPNASWPQAPLVQDTNGTFYGTTAEGGEDGLYMGTVFSFSTGLGPFVETQPTSAKVGKPVNILGTDLTGATSVTFNGTAATFTVVSSSLIGTTVPAGATTGTVQVVTPGGTLSSNVPFRVLP